MKIGYLAFVLLFSGGCDAPWLQWGAAAADVVPPQLSGAAAESPQALRIEFTDPPLASAGDFSVEPEMGIESVYAEESALVVRFENEQTPGEPYLCRGTASDEAGNALDFVVRFHGYNGNPAQMLISEFNPEGSNSGNNPEIVEFYVTQSGNLGGMAFYQGVPGDFKSRKIFPAVEVERGDFILLHARWDPERHPGKDTVKTDETGADLNAAQARHASASARDFWLEEPNGISGSNAVLSLYSTADDGLQDAVIYANENSRNKGWSSQMERWCGAIHAAGGWAAAGTDIEPADVIAVDDSSTTRSINRRIDFFDSDTASDWHIAPTSGLTFGEPNNPEEYGG